MIHLPGLGDTYLTVQPEKDSFGSFEPRQEKLQEASANDELTGRKGLNWGEICDVGASLEQAFELTGSFDPREVKSVEIGNQPEPEIGGLEAPGNGIVLDTAAPGMSMHQGAMNSIQVIDAAGNIAEGFRLGPGATFEDITETFEPLAGMHSFGESLNHVLEIGSTSGPGGKSYMTGQFDFPTNNIGGSASPGGDNV